MVKNINSGIEKYRRMKNIERTLIQPRNTFNSHLMGYVGECVCVNDTCMHVPSVSEGRKPLRLQTFEISHFCWSPDFQLLFLVLREMRVACCDRMGEDFMKFFYLRLSFRRRNVHLPFASISASRCDSRCCSRTSVVLLMELVLQLLRRHARLMMMLNNRMIAVNWQAVRLEDFFVVAVA